MRHGGHLHIGDSLSHKLCLINLKTVICPLTLLLTDVPLSFSAVVYRGKDCCAGQIGQGHVSPLTPLAFEDYLICQRMLGVDVEKTKWICTLRLSPHCHELVAWLPSGRAGDGGIAHAVFLHIHSDTEKLWKRDTIVSTT